jgi:hypothetical protein
VTRRDCWKSTCCAIVSPGEDHTGDVWKAQFRLCARIIGASFIRCSTTQKMCMRVNGSRQKWTGNYGISGVLLPVSHTGREGVRPRYLKERSLRLQIKRLQCAAQDNHLSVSPSADETGSRDELPNGSESPQRGCCLPSGNRLIPRLVSCGVRDDLHFSPGLGNWGVRYCLFFG